MIAACFLGCNEATLSLFPGAPDSAAPSNQTPPMTSEPGLVSQWSFDSDAHDSAGNNDGTLQGTATFVADSIRGEVLACDGSASAVTLANQTTLDFSYAVWLWTDTPSGPGENARDGAAILWSNDGARFDDFTLSLLNDRLSFLSYNEHSTGTRLLNDATWHQVVITRRDGERVALYVDGQTDGDGNSGSGPVLANPTIYVCANPVDGHYFAGKMDDLRFYDRVLSEGDVLDLYRLTSR